jgi:hypothetical protein
MNTKAIAYDLGVAGIAITLWLAPWDIARAIGYASSVAFSGRAYLTGVSLIARERRNDEKEAITYEAEVDFYEQLVGNHVDAELQIKSLEIENKLLQRLAPLLAMKHQLDRQLDSSIVSQVDKNLDAVPTEEKALDGVSESKENPEQFRERFPENMDATSWKAILKALANGATRKEIIADVLSCPSAEEKLGGQYLDYLKGRYMDI